jgi:hypothetical protein
MGWQLYWPNWWKIWPHHTVDDDCVGGMTIRCHVLCIGPLQMFWYSA